jgi:hypothetical protein
MFRDQPFSQNVMPGVQDVLFDLADYAHELLPVLHAIPRPRVLPGQHQDDIDIVIIMSSTTPTSMLRKSAG